MENISLMVVLAQLLNFLVIFLLFKKFVADKLNKTIANRRVMLKSLENAKEEYSKMLEQAHEDKSIILNDARKEAKKLFSEIESMARTRENEIIERAQTQAINIVSKAKREMENDKKAMITDIKEHIVSMALRLNKKLFKKNNVSEDFMRIELEKIS